MRNFSLMLLVGGFAFATLFHFDAEIANSRQQYAKEFRVHYLTADSTNADQKSLDDAVKGASCNVCHVNGKSKSTRNAYGMELAKLLRPKEASPEFRGETDHQKIDEAFDKIAGMHVDANDPKSPTYGDLIKHGKLPASASKPASNTDSKTP